MRDPAFWWDPPGWRSRLLMPLALAYGAVAGRCMRRRGTVMPVPVICVGNYTIGGAGKTPTAIAIAKLLMQRGASPFFLTRGYGGRLAGPVRVAATHVAADVGDEPLLLTQVAPTIVAADRLAGAALAVAHGASVIVMDDGFQNPSLVKSLSLIAIDGQRGLGNGYVIPAGPLRAPLSIQLARTDAVVIVGKSTATPADLGARAMLHARLRPRPDRLAALTARPVFAFAGIGHPDKLFTTLADAGIAVADRRAFADHHRYTAADARDLLAQAGNLTLVTTEKDLARMRGEPALVSLVAATQTLPVDLVFDDEGAIGALLDAALAIAHGPDGSAA